MKKTIVLLLAGVAALVSIADEASIGRAVTQIADAANGTVSSTNYNGFAKTTAGSTVTTNQSVWKVVRTKVDSSGLVTETKHAYGSGGNALWSTSWTNRAAATYK